VLNNYAGILPAGVFRMTTTVTAFPELLSTTLLAIGFAWQPTGSSLWVVRGGGGMFYDLTRGVPYWANHDQHAGVGQPQINGLQLSTLAESLYSVSSDLAGPGCSDSSLAGQHGRGSSKFRSVRLVHCRGYTVP